MINRLFGLLRRRSNARKLGFTFARAAAFELPATVSLLNESKELVLPSENGVKVAFVELLLDDCYQLSKIPENISTIIDIGANVGLFGIAARSRFPLAKIHAYEPNLSLEPYLKQQASSAQVRYFMEAVGHSDGFVALDKNSDSVLTRSKPDSSGGVPQISFRRAIERLGGKVDLVKLDCEGAEWEIFEDKESWSSVSWLTMEYHLWPNHSHEEVADVVQTLGFTVLMQRPAVSDGMILACQKSD